MDTNREHNMNRISARIAYLAKMIDIYNRTRAAEVARGVNAEWLDTNNAANVAELANLRDCYNNDGSIKRTPADLAEEARMGRALRAAARRGAL
jgi:hypothetical protein